MIATSTILGATAKALKGSGFIEDSDSKIRVPGLFMNTLRLPQPLTGSSPLARGTPEKT